MEMILRIKDRLFEYEELVLIFSKNFLIDSISLAIARIHSVILPLLKICKILFLMSFMVVFDHDRFY